MRKLLAALCLVFALALPAKAADSCFAWQPALERASQAGWLGVELKDDSLARFVANYNAMPPKSNVHPDSVWVMMDTKSQDEVVTLVFVTGGCVDAVLPDVPEAAFEKTLTDTPGDPA